jgi:hypothetical protein
MNEAQLFPWLMVVWVVVALAVVPYLLLRPAPYGRHGRPGWGPTLPARLAWVLMELPSPALMVIMFWVGNRRSDVVAVAFLCLWLGHYLYRTFIFAFLLPASSRPMPAVVVASGALFNVVNGGMNGRWLFSLSQMRPAEWLASAPFIVGTALFITGFCIHVLADRELRRVRRESAGRYGIPQGRLFRLVSCPNYMGELIEWSGWALATMSWPGLVFVLWSAANLVPRAIKHHAWYRATFADYPASRKAVVPFVL